MNKRFLLSLLASPTVLASMVSMMAMANRVNAAELVTQPANSVSCVGSPRAAQFTCVRVAQADTTTSQAAPPAVGDTQQQDNPDVLEFTEEESDAAVAKYGCDCPACINGIRAMRGLPLIN
ncbi:hypothetical protein H6F77_21300 [Microcoleus sp. FACHB-831]|uniref:hypothetical protein n=1 Tax=Microcoleus sp. FACHB-831 TaxID=2692827 RepID=UPI0016897FE1|nr:hypothetical protein [Microcoleus sp. FACHB-831]MBD1923589.1 hypothetical protein [Microcoleus sp. FACHB-831]